MSSLLAFQSYLKKFHDLVLAEVVVRVPEEFVIDVVEIVSVGHIKFI